VKVIGHRGCPAHGPENTVRAIRRALPHVDGIEVDARRCGSGEVVVVHDADLARLAGVDAAVADLTAAELSAVGVDGTDASIPTLREVIEVVPAGKLLNVELKEAGIAGDVADLLADADADLLVSSFLPDALRELDGTGLPRALLFKYGWRGRLDQAVALDCSAVHPHFRLLDAGAVAAAHDRGLAVNAWTVTRPRDAAHLRGLGADGVVVDDWRVVERDGG